MTIGGVSLQAGDFLLVRTAAPTTRTSRRFRPTDDVDRPDRRDAHAAGRRRQLGGIGFSHEQLYGLELVQHDTCLGGVALTQGQLLMTVNGSTNVAGNQLAVDARDVFVLSVTGTGHETSTGTAAMLVRGADLGLTGGSEEIDYASRWSASTTPHRC